LKPESQELFRRSYVIGKSALLDRPPMVRRGSNLRSTYVGQTERNIARMFAEMYPGPLVDNHLHQICCREILQGFNPIPDR